MTAQPQLTAARVDEIFRECLFREDEIVNGKPPCPPAVGEGAVLNAGFHPGRLDSYKDEIGSLLRCLPDQFHSNKGGGWSFLNAAVDRDGNHWAEHQTIDQLLTLGIAAGLAEMQLPREMWPMLPGGMPYFSVTGGAE